MFEKGNTIKGPAGFELKTYRFVANAHCYI